jgi:hypothetical protein
MATALGEVEGFELEIPDEGGKTQAVLQGTRALFDPQGTIDIDDAKATIYQQEKGEVVMISPHARYHRDAKLVTSEEPVDIVSKDSHITGEGLVWEPDKEKIVIQGSVRAILTNVREE